MINPKSERLVQVSDSGDGFGGVLRSLTIPGRAFSVLEDEMEEWRVIPGFPNYAASNLGRIKRACPGQGTRADKMLNPALNSDGYRVVDLWHNGLRNQCRVACLVAMTFLGPRPEGTLVHHKDETLTNDVPTNLEYKSFREHNLVHVAVFSGKNGSNTRLTEEDVFYLRYWMRTELTYSEIAEIFNISPGYLSRLAQGGAWAHY